MSYTESRASVLAVTPQLLMVNENVVVEAEAFCLFWSSRTPTLSIINNYIRREAPKCLYRCQECWNLTLDQRVQRQNISKDLQEEAELSRSPDRVP